MSDTEKEVAEETEISNRPLPERCLKTASAWEES